MNASGNNGSKSDARELPPAGERVGVVVRVRPLLGAEAHREPAVRVDPEDARSVQVLTTVADSSAAETPTSGNMYGTISAKAGARAFRFDACLGDRSDGGRVRVRATVVEGGRATAPCAKPRAHPSTSKRSRPPTRVEEM